MRPDQEAAFNHGQHYFHHGYRDSDLHDQDVWQADDAVVARILDQIGKRFRDERTKGFTHPKSGPQAPVPPEEAEQRWQRARPRYHDIVRKYDPDVNARLGAFRYDPARARSKHAELDEPSLRRGESLVDRVCGKKVEG